ncbi:MAG: hypothetical protein KDD58_00495 [Bdellovibrionales bacterium]|nr:hypothetical protein [Bdellovibrionales bacterium]
MAYRISSLPSLPLNKAGQSMVLLVIILPGFFLLWTLSLEVYKFLSFKERSVHVCRQELLKYQEINLKGLQRLVSINPQAQQLRIKRKIAEAAYSLAKKSKQPYAIAAAWGNLKLVIAEQKTFSLIQKSIISSTEALAWKQLHQARQNIFQLHFIHNYPLSHQQNFLAIKKMPRNSLTPDYILRSNFEKKQNVTLLWPLTFLRKIDMKKTNDIQLQCSATIDAKEQPWQVVLSHADKL